MANTSTTSAGTDHFSDRDSKYFSVLSEPTTEFSVYEACCCQAAGHPHPERAEPAADGQEADLVPGEHRGHPHHRRRRHARRLQPALGTLQTRAPPHRHR